MKTLSFTAMLAIWTAFLISQVTASLLHVRNESDAEGAFEVSSSNFMDELFGQPHLQLVRRDDIDPPASDSAWEGFKCKGTKLFAMMYADDKDAGQLLNPPKDSAASYWTNFPAAFRHWFWFYNEFDLKDFGEKYYGIADALKGLGVSTNQGDWKFWRITHGNYGKNVNMEEQKYVTDGKEYRATASSYIILVNTKDGAIVIAWAFGAKAMAAKRSPPVTTLPDLQQTSDIAYGCWAMSGGKNNLKHIINWGITNAATQTAIARIMRDSKFSYVVPWPGIQVSADGDAGKALLGTPTGVGVGYMLAQHKEGLGKKKVTGVRIFEGNSRAWEARVPPMIYWSVGDV